MGLETHESDAARRLDVVEEKAAYDGNAKYLFAEKIFLAHILAYAVPEFSGILPEEIVSLIEGEPQVGIVPVMLRIRFPNTVFRRKMLWEICGETAILI